jgi:hypothetical protein
MSLVSAALATTPIFLFADMGNIGGGGFVKFLAGLGYSVRSARALAVVIGAGLILTAILANFVENSYVCVALLAIAGFGVTSLMTNLLACYQEISFASIGLVMGLLGGFGCVVGATVNPLIGAYIDKTGNYNLIFVLLGVVPILTMSSILLFGIVNRPHERRG